MKPIVLSFLLFALSSLKAQDSLRLLSRFEAFSAEKHVLKKIETARIGYVGETEITFQKVSNPGGRSREAVVLAQARRSAASLFTTRPLYVDFDELDGLCKALNRFLEESNKKEPPKNEPYYTYTTNNNVVVSLVYTSLEVVTAGWNIVVSQRYADSGNIIPGSVVNVKTSEIDGFVLAFKNALRLGDL